MTRNPVTPVDALLLANKNHTVCLHAGLKVETLYHYQEETVFYNDK